MQTEVEAQRENVETLIKLMNENPKLRVVPMVDSEVVADDGCSYWLGAFNTSEIDYVFVSDERIYFKSIDEEELVSDEIDRIGDEAEIAPRSPSFYKIVAELAENIVKSYEWEKVIAVWIGIP